MRSLAVAAALTFLLTSLTMDSCLESLVQLSSRYARYLLPLSLGSFFYNMDCDLTLWLHSKIGRSCKCYAGQVVWITGASSGIGEVLAHILAGAGAKLVLCGTREHRLQGVKEKCLALNSSLTERDIMVLSFDMKETGKLPAFVNQVREHFGRIDVLVNNAGRTQRALFEETELDVDREMFDVNVFGLIHLTRAVLKVSVSRVSFARTDASADVVQRRSGRTDRRDVQHLGEGRGSLLQHIHGKQARLAWLLRVTAERELQQWRSHHDGLSRTRGVGDHRASVHWFPGLQVAWQSSRREQEDGHESLRLPRRSRDGQPSGRSLDRKATLPPLLLRTTVPAFSYKEPLSTHHDEGAHHAPSRWRRPARDSRCRRESMKQEAARTRVAGDAARNRKQLSCSSLEHYSK